MTLTEKPRDQIADAFGLMAFERLTRDVRNAGKTLTDDEARYLVDIYYTVQDDRKRLNSQRKASDRYAVGEPHEVLDWFWTSFTTLENDIKKILDQYTQAKPVGRWARSICGIGEVLVAGLLAHTDITHCPTVGHFWRFAGLDVPANYNWTKGVKRPWNADLKVLCWKIGDSFVKVSSEDLHPDDVYGKVYRARKEQEWVHNMAHDFENQDAQCDRGLAKLRPGGDQDGRYWYAGCLTAENADLCRMVDGTRRPALVRKLAGEPGSGVRMLPPAQIDQRAKRYATKLFLSHYHECAYFVHYGTLPPFPYPIVHLGHAHFVAAPNMHLILGWQEAREKVA